MVGPDLSADGFAEAVSLTTYPYFSVTSQRRLQYNPTCEYRSSNSGHFETSTSNWWSSRKEYYNIFKSRLEHISIHVQEVTDTSEDSHNTAETSHPASPANHVVEREICIAGGIHTRNNT